MNSGVTRRDAIKGIISFLAGGTILGNENKANAIELFPYEGGRIENLRGLYATHTLGKSIPAQYGTIDLVTGIGRDNRAFLAKGDNACIGLAQNRGKYPYELALWCPEKNEAELFLAFSQGTPHGRFDIRNKIEDVSINAYSGAELYIIRGPRSTTPLISGSNSKGDYDIHSGNILLRARGNDISINTKAISPLRSGATPFRLKDSRRMGNTQLTINRNGTIS
jgi:hypothetical protein